MSLIEFDPAKNDENRRKHGVDLEQFAEIDLSTAVAVADTRRDYGRRGCASSGLSAVDCSRR